MQSLVAAFGISYAVAGYADLSEDGFPFAVF